MTPEIKRKWIEDLRSYGEKVVLPKIEKSENMNKQELINKLIEEWDELEVYQVFDTDSVSVLSMDEMYVQYCERIGDERGPNADFSDVTEEAAIADLLEDVVIMNK